jgi:hypothetical protein
VEVDVHAVGIPAVQVWVVEELPVSVDDFALVVVGDTDWAWDLDAVLAAIAATSPQATIRDGYPLPGSPFRARAYIADARAGREMKVILHESGKMIGLEYGSPEGSAEFVTWVLNRFPPPDDVTVQLYEWGHNPRVTAQTTVQDLLAIGP